MSHGLSVLRFAAAMEEKLIANDHKTGWAGCSLRWLINRLRQETSELDGAIRRVAKSTDSRAADAVLHEAADVANFAMMIAENARQRVEDNVAAERARADAAVADRAWEADHAR